MAKQVISDVHTFLNARMNTDDADIALKENEYRMLTNSLATAPGYVGKLKKMRGFKNVMTLPINLDFTLPSGTFTVVGSCEDIKNSAIVYFLCDTSSNNNHGIFRMFTSNNKLEWILKSQSALNFHVGYIISSLIVENLLYWTDNYEGVPFLDFNPPRQINIARAVGYTNPYDINKVYNYGDNAGYGGKTYQWIDPLPGQSVTPTNPNPKYWLLVDDYPISSITSDKLKRIKPCPQTQPEVSYDSDITVLKNDLRGYLFQFAVRWIYADGERSVFGAWSNIPFPGGEEYLIPHDINGVVQTGLPANGYYLSEITVNNVILVGIDTGDENVIGMELAVANTSNYNLWKLATTINKFDSNGNRLVSDFTTVLYKFYNTTSELALDNEDFFRLFDFVPQVSGGETLIESNRILDFNYIQDFDNIVTNNKYTVVPQDINNLPLTSNYSGVNGTEPSSHAPGSVYVDLSSIPLIVGTVVQCVIYRFTYLLLNPTTPPPYGNTDGSQQLNVSVVISPTDTRATIVYRLGNLINQRIASEYQGDGIPKQDMYFMQYAGNFVTPTTLACHQSTILQYYPSYHASDLYFIQEMYVSYIPAIVKIPNLKSGATHFFGQEYADDDMRVIPIQKQDTDSVFIPFLADKFGNGGTSTDGHILMNQFKINWQIYHQPPIGAKYWRWAYGGSDVDYYMQFVIRVKDLITQNTNTAIQVNQYLLTTATEFPKWNIQNYQWQKGDRIRFLARQLVADFDASYVYFAPYADFEILDMDYFWTNTDPSFYQKDVTGQDELTDANGNKIPNTGYLSILMPYIDKASFFIDTPTKNECLIFEVYRPKQVGQTGAITEYQECEDWNDVVDPHLPTRRHGASMGGIAQSANLVTPASGTFTFGDSYTKIRVSSISNFPCEAMEFSDYYDSSVVSTGRTNLYNPNSKRLRYLSNLLYSGAFIQNTAINDLSKVLSSNSITLKDDYGTINYVKQVGFMLKIIQQKKPTSIPVNRVMFTQAGGGADVVGTSKNILGEPIPHPSDYGTTHFTGVVKHENRIYFPDLYAGLILMDSDNGIHPVSMEYKVHNFVSSRFTSFLNDGIQNISIYSAYDELYGLVYFSFVDSVNPSLNFTIAFKEGTEITSGFLAFDFVPDFYGSTKDTVTSWKNGALWVHNDDSVPPMNFYGTQYYQIISFVANKMGGVTKDHKAIVLTATEEYFAPNVGDVTIQANGTYREKQTKIPKGKFRKKEGKYYTDIPRNMLTSGNVARMSDYLNGEVMRGEVLEVSLTNDSVEDSEMTAITVNSIYSIGT